MKGIVEIETTRLGIDSICCISGSEESRLPPRWQTWMNGGMVVPSTVIGKFRRGGRLERKEEFWFGHVEIKTLMI